MECVAELGTLSRVASDGARMAKHARRDRVAWSYLASDALSWTQRVQIHALTFVLFCECKFGVSENCCCDHVVEFVWKEINGADQCGMGNAKDGI